MKKINLLVILAFLCLQTQTTFSQTKLLMEKLTAVWCGWCPENDLEIDDLVEQYGAENIVVVKHHVMDAMSTEFGDQVAEEFINGTPGMLFNRIKFEDQWNVSVTRTEWTEHMPLAMDMLQDIVNISSEHSYDPTTRNLEIDIEMDFLESLSGDYRVNCYIVEDVVSSPSNAFSQSNYWAGEDHELGSMPNPIPEYEHTNVVREILGGPWGLPGVFNESIEAGENVNTLFFYSVPEFIDHENLTYVIMVQEYNDDKFQRQVINSHDQKVLLGTASGIDEVKNGLTVFPNPVSDFLNIQAETEIEGLRVFNSRGQELYLKNDDNGLFVSDLPIGWYILQVQTANGTVHHKFIKE